MKFTIPVLAACAVLGASAAQAATPQDEMFVNQAAIGGLSEVQAGIQAETRATSPRLKAFAQQMVAGHTPNNEQLMTLAGKKGLTPPAALDAAHTAKLSGLQNVAPAMFDATYVRGQIAGHQEMEMVMQQEIQSGTDPDLVAFATKTLPVVREHLVMIQQLASAAP